MRNYDLIVIGGGPAGYVAAIRAAQLGMKTACVEMRKTFGGTCLNIGCIPSKALLDSSEQFAHLKSGLSKHGISVGEVKLDLEQMMKRKEAIVRQLVTGVGGLLKKNKIDAIIGKARLTGKKENNQHIVEVTSDSDGPKTISGTNILLATGSVPVELPFLKFDGKKIISSTEALSLPQVPAHLVVIGGGVIGLELGSVWGRLGSRVTVIEFQKRICGATDAGAAIELQKCLTKQGLQIRTATKCLGAKASGDQMLVEIEELETGKKESIECSLILVATGRKPYSDGLGLEDAKIPQDKLGRVQIDDQFRTPVPGIYAVGDLVRGPMLAHKAEDEGMAAAEIMAGQHGHVNYQAIPSVIYTWPELASVGFSEEELKEKGIAYKTGSFPFVHNGRAKAMEALDGWVKILADAKSDRILGAHIVGPWASDLISELTLAIEFGGSSEDVARTCHGHPTLSEVVKEAALACEKRQIHL